MTFPTITLPARPLAMKRGTIRTPFVYYFAVPVLLAIAAFMIFSEAPGILRDYTISQNPLVIDGRVDGSCKTRKAVFTTCEVDLSYMHGGQRYENDVEIMFVDIHSGAYETDLVISAVRPELATISLGLEKLWNRIFILSAFVFLLGGGSFVMILLALRVWRVRRTLGTPAPLTVTPVEITAMDTRRGYLNVTYFDRISERKTKRVAFTRFKAGQEPIIVGDAGSNPVALAVWHGNAALPVLLDDRLERIEMSEQERVAALGPLRDMAQASGNSPLTSNPAAPKPGMSLMRRAGLVLLVAVLIVAGVFGYWLWYVTSAPSQYNSPGMDINNSMPEALNRWGCDQLKSRFGDGPAPFGCTTADHRSWK